VSEATAEPKSPEALAVDVAAARDRLIAFLGTCDPGQWRASVLGDGDPRPVGVVFDHVAHSYEYMGEWVTALVAGEDPQVDAALVDELNAGHAAAAVSASPTDVADHLRRSGDAFVALTRGLSREDLGLGRGRVRRIVEIAARHCDAHRTEVETGLAACS
jgi:hypothetical protein